jgi:hypothetical protein
LLYSEILGGPRLTAFDVAQLPWTTGDRWLGLSKSPGAAPSSRLSLVIHTPVPLAPNTPIAGLVLDEWVELLPASQQVSGVSFQYDDPVARPPQTILLAVRPDDFPEWTLESLEGSALEALELAKLRAVDPDALEALGHFLPALYFAFNSGRAEVNAVSTDFSVTAPAAKGGQN